MNSGLAPLSLRRPQFGESPVYRTRITSGAFPSWLLRIECGRWGKVQTVNQVHSARAYMALRVILDRMRHDGCGGRAGKAELLTGIEGVSSRPVRRIVLRD